MKKYFLVLLKKGTGIVQDSSKLAQIQADHLTHLNEMVEAGKLCIAGPIGDDRDLRGILILNVPKEEEAIQLISEDPAVKAGRLNYEVMSWWAAKGSVLE